MTVQQLQHKAHELYNQMDWLELEDKSKRVIIVDNAKDEQFLLGLTYYVSENTSLSTDSVYRFTMEALSQLADADMSDVEEHEATRDMFYEVSSGMEADMYTSDLTEWLTESNYHVYYLTQALQEFQPTDGIEALAMAQLNAKVEALDRVLDYLVEHQEELV